MLWRLVGAGLFGLVVFTDTVIVALHAVVGFGVVAAWTLAARSRAVALRMLFGLVTLATVLLRLALLWLGAILVSWDEWS